MTSQPSSASDDDWFVLDPLERGEAVEAASNWPCGHARTLDNTQSIGSAGVRCRACRRAISIRSWRKRQAEKAAPSVHIRPKGRGA